VIDSFNDRVRDELLQQMLNEILDHIEMSSPQTVVRVPDLHDCSAVCEGEVCKYRRL